MQSKINSYLGAVEIQAPVISAADYIQVLNNAVSALSAKSYIEQSSLDQLQQAYQYIFSTIETCMSTGLSQSISKMWSGWGWQSLISKPELHIGLLEIHQYSNIPIHDHPGGCGILIVLKGKLAVTTYQNSDDSNTGSSGLAVLYKQASHILQEKEYVSITETEGNIHSLASINESCLVLDILLKPYDENLRTWYMPVSEQVSDKNSFVCFCVNRLNDFGKGC